MNAAPPYARGRAARRRLLASTVLAVVAAFAATSVPAYAATTATFNSNTATLTVSGDNLDNTITVSRDPAGKLLVNGGAVAVAGGTPTIANTTLIRVSGQGGHDTITLSEASGALPKANLSGGVGNDTLIGGSGADQLSGQSGTDTLLGKGGPDELLGGTDNDTITGGDADDRAIGEGGNDRMVWNPGDDTDLNEGGDGTDSVEVNGGGGAEQFATTANSPRVRFDRLDPAPFSIDIGSSEKLVLKANGGDDSYSATGNLAALIQITVDGGAGADTILGSNGADQLLGGDGNDLLDGQQGNDSAFLGAGDDTFQWDPGDGSDTVEGQADTDTMRFNGSAGDEVFEASANGARLRFTRNPGNIAMDTDDLEVVDLRALGGTDAITVNSLSGTDVTTLVGDLAGTLGGSAGDGRADTVTINGTNGSDIVDVVGAGTSASVLGQAARVNITNSEGANDALVVNALGGDDGVTATTVPAGVINLTGNGGAGEDSLLGSQGADTLLGGDNDDSIFGDNGDDVALMGAGDDAFQWNPGDGNDTLEGQDGTDQMRFFGANIGENIDISANGGRVRFLRNIANVTMDLDDVENIDFRALGGADNIVVGDLTGTDLNPIDLDLRGPNGGGDGAADAVTVNGTQGGDAFSAAGDAGGVDVLGLAAAVHVVAQEQANDRLTLNGQAGDDHIDASLLKPDGIQLTENGGLGADATLGSQGDDLISGGDGDDTALLREGDDTFVWSPGDDNDTLEGQAGFDTMRFNGANIAETIELSANGGRVRFTRDIATVTMDLDDVEGVDFNALGGADNVLVHDLSGTDLTEVNTNLATATGAGDAAPDNLLVEGTEADDVSVIAGDASGVAVLGLAARVNITGAEAANDRLRVNTRAGDDVVDATSLAAGSIQLTVDGGDDDDVLLGGAGDDVLLGGAGDDVLIGGPGTDTIDGGPGSNIVIQSLVPDTVTAAATVGTEWLKSHARIADGKTVLGVRGKEHTLPRADLPELARGAATG
jgi:Ca2+-binding RTX toxin-like protein